MDECHEAREQKHFKEMGVHLEKPDSNNGEVSVTYDWKKVEQYDKKWDDWFRHESRKPETREIAKHLNKAAKLMVNDIAAGQVAAVKNSAKLLGAYVRWIEPTSQCDAEALVTCLDTKGADKIASGMHCKEGKYKRYCWTDQHWNTGDGGNPLNLHHDKRHVFYGECAKKTDCETRKHGRERREISHDGRHAAHKVKHALKHMEREVVHDFKKEMADQRANVKKVTGDFLKETRERYTAWGCEPRCTEHHTRHVWDLMGMKHCDCPDSITVSGDTSVIFH